MKFRIHYQIPYRTGKLVTYTDWHAGHYFHRIEEHVIEFLDESKMIWYQNILVKGSSGDHVFRFEGNYTIDHRWNMIQAELFFENQKKVLNGSFSLHKETIVLDIRTFRDEKLVESRAYCFELNDAK